VQLGLPAESPLKLDYPSPRLTSEPDRAAQVLQSIGFDVLDQPALVLCPGAEFGPAKRWPAQSFAAVAKSKVSEGWQVWIIGNSADQLIGEEI
jgi:heptosyltransferase-2